MIKNPPTTNSTKMTRNYRMNHGKLKLQKNSQSQCGKSYDNTDHTMLTQNGAYSA